VVPPRSDRITRVPPYSRTSNLSIRTGLSPAMARLSRRFRFLTRSHWPGPRSLATTSGVSVDVLSSGYVRCFSSPGLPPLPMDSAEDHLTVGFPHSEICGSKPARGSPQLIAACYVLHRLSEPRHPRNALLALDLSMRRDKPGACALLPTIAIHGTNSMKTNR
jgi:hypothetical protein